MTIRKTALNKVIQSNTLFSADISSCEQDYPTFQAVQDIYMLYADEEIDLLVITTPSTNHYEIAKQARWPASMW